MALDSVWAIIHNTVSMSRADGASPYVLALGISAFDLFVGVEAARVGDISVLFPPAPFSLAVWLLLPTVRVADIGLIAR